MAKKKATKKAAKKSTKAKPAKKSTSKTGGGRSALRSPPNPTNISKRTFTLNESTTIQIFGSRLNAGQPKFKTTTPNGISWQLKVINHENGAVMVVRVTPWGSLRKKRSETGDLTITVLSDGEEGDVTFNDIVFEEP